MEYEFIEYEELDDIAIMAINRPEAMNALNDDVMNNINKCIDDINLRAHLKCVIITGKGKAFIAGADIAMMKEKNYEEGKQTAQKGTNIYKKIENLPIPVIAMVNGYALGGGCELALSCDFRVAGEYAKFGQPEVKLGITPGYGGTQRLPRLIGPGLAKELIYTGGMIDAKEAYRIGLVNHVFPNEQLREETLKIAHQIVKNGPLAIKHSKQVINEGLKVNLDEGLDLEIEHFGKCFATKDQEEGMSAFLEKRKPNFKGE